jgi:hypothetical protein
VGDVVQVWSCYEQHGRREFHTTLSRMRQFGAAEQQRLVGSAWHVTHLNDLPVTVAKHLCKMRELGILMTMQGDAICCSSLYSNDR